MRFKSKEDLEKWIAGAKKAAVSPVKTPSAEPALLDPSLQRRILGVDTALRTTGWGIIDVRGSTMKAVDCGVIKNAAKEKISDCLRRLAGGIRELVELYHPEAAVLEGAFYCQNVRTAMMLGHARGAVIAVLAEHHIPVREYAPRRIKQAICGFGNASKEQVALLVAQFLSIQTENLALDSTDALAMAICHAQDITTANGLGLPTEL